MDLLPYVATVLTGTDLSVPVTDAATFTDTAETVTDTVTEFADKFLNMDFANDVIMQYAKVFAIGFAVATLLILFTYGVFKAFSLVRID